jgi:kynurenine formamidase
MMTKFPYNIIDLTHELGQDIPSWDGNCGFRHEVLLDYEDCTIRNRTLRTEVQFRVQKLHMEAGIGTHIDAPAHCIPGGTTVEQLELKNLAAPAVVIDISSRMKDFLQLSGSQFGGWDDKSLSVQPTDILDFEKQHGEIAPGSFVIIHTGWSRYWGNPEKYRNNHHFPSVAGSTAELLLERNIAGLGIDTLSPDRPADGFHVHKILLGAGKYIVENISSADKLPPTGAYTLALPIKITGGTEAPVRLIAFL